MRSVVFTDIDETLTRSARRSPPEPGALLAATDRAGAPTAFQTAAQAHLFAWLAQADRVIPVTGRSVDAYRRVRLPFHAEAVVHHGAVVLGEGGARDEDYRALVAAELRAVDDVLARAFAHVTDWIPRARVPLRVYRQVVDELTAEVCVKHVDPEGRELGEGGDELEAAWGSLDGVRVYRNGNNLALLPAAVDKARAVAWLRARLVDRLGPLMTVGVGDSTTDYAFMAACDFYVVPSGSQLDGRVARGVAAP